jgi:hypothetical protein
MQVTPSSNLISALSALQQKRAEAPRLAAPPPLAAREPERVAAPVQQRNQPLGRTLDIRV